MRCPARSQAVMSWRPGSLLTRLPTTNRIDLMLFPESAASIRWLISCHCRLAPPSVVGSSKVNAISVAWPCAHARVIPAMVAAIVVLRRNSLRFMEWADYRSLQGPRQRRGIWFVLAKLRILPKPLFWHSVFVVQQLSMVDRAVRFLQQRSTLSCDLHNAFDHLLLGGTNALQPLPDGFTHRDGNAFARGVCQFPRQSVGFLVFDA